MCIHVRLERSYLAGNLLCDVIPRMQQLEAIQQDKTENLEVLSLTKAVARPLLHLLRTSCSTPLSKQTSILHYNQGFHSGKPILPI